MSRVLILLGLIAALLLSACGQASSPSLSTSSPLRDKLTVGLTADAESLDPYFVNQVAGESITKSIFDNLLERDFAGQIVPGLATAWRIVDDRTIELTLRRGVQFHNGEPFNAASVQFSIERILNPALKSPSRSLYASIARVEVMDDYTVRLRLSKTDATLLDALTDRLAMLPPNYLREKGDEGFARAPVGTGPFRFVEWVRDDHVTLEANPNYWPGSFKGQPRVKTVIFRPIPESSTRIADLLTGAADIISDVPPDQIKRLEAAGLRVVSVDAPRYAFIFLVTDAGGPLSDVRVRQALNYGVNVEGIVQNLLAGQGQRIASPFGPRTLGYDPTLQPYTYDPERARALLKDAGYPNGFRATVDAASSDPGETLEAVVGDLAKIGVQVEIRRLELGLFNDNWVKKNTSEMIAARWGNLFDPTGMRFFAVSEGVLSRYHNPEVDRLMAEAAATLDLSRREALYRQASRLLHDDPLAIYLWNSVTSFGFSSRVEGFRPTPRNYIVVSGVGVK